MRSRRANGQMIRGLCQNASPKHPDSLPLLRAMNVCPILFLASLLAALSLASCRSLPPQPASALAHGDTIPWRYDQVAGLSMTLDDPKRIEYYGFGQKGALAMTVGERGGMVTGPLLGWRLDRGRLFICDAGGKDLGTELFLVRYSDDEVIIRRASGELARFKRQAN